MKSRMLARSSIALPVLIAGIYTPLTLGAFTA